ncbi:hypothetical protein OOK60_06255 [Trichothermofontia sichuanensis B231]|uniref:hypothetical protein n=1 Tax=Trichothermofontia sichuanensis TaxID=3045816 RepID=UPI00224838C2|nr:hypothetical protein OOK60_06255 [Trichothermofontia sichuanensis B231]
MANFSRRKFLVTAGVSAASSIFLKACVGNPPSTTNTGTGTGTGASPSPTATPSPVAAGDTPETTQIKLGYLPIFEMTLGLCQL